MILITLGHCFPPTPDGYPLRASTVTRVPAENPLAGVLWHCHLRSHVPSMVEHARVRMSQKNEMRKTDVVDHYSVLR